MNKKVVLELIHLKKKEAVSFSVSERDNSLLGSYHAYQLSLHGKTVLKQPGRRTLKLRLGSLNSNESLRILFSQVLHFDTFRSCDITFIIVLPSSTVLTEMSFDSADRPYWHNITRGNPLALTLSFYARGFERERNAKEKALPSFSQLVQQKIPKAGIRTLHLAHTIQSLCCFTTFSKLIRTR